eukprot:TRINITY_DN7400_c0_g2_i6.p1 TRINITY_DN7400_c0_g2~~TRINITY_DN7400_c0_g2_i6.p1  ORF type:complete len:264 (-),score=9.83 TRINITY_DN7400_c0_g2_i6:565-1356(-)
MFSIARSLLRGSGQCLGVYKTLYEGIYMQKYVSMLSFCSLATLSVVTSLMVWNMWERSVGNVVEARDSKQTWLMDCYYSFLVPEIFIPRFSPMITGLLVQTGLMPYVVIDLRSSSDTVLNPLPDELRQNSVHLSISQLSRALSSRQHWKSMLPFVEYPDFSDILLLIAESEQQKKYAAAVAAGLSYQRIALLDDNFKDHSKALNTASKIGKLNKNLVSNFRDVLQCTWPEAAKESDQEITCDDILNFYDDFLFDSQSSTSSSS